MDDSNLDIPSGPMPEGAPPPPPPVDETDLLQITTGAPSSAKPLLCEVVDPQHHGDGLSKYTSYCVLVANVSAVRRRYNDFQWLYDRLNVEVPGAIIPIIPHKRVRLLKQELKFTAEFVAERMAIIQAWIRRVLEHPLLKDAACVASFMRQDDELFALAKKANDAHLNSLSLSENEDVHGSDIDADVFTDNGSGSAAEGKPRFGRIRSLFAKAAMRTGVEMAKVEDEELFAEIEKYVTKLDKDAQIFTKQISIFSKSTKASADATQEMAKSFSGLSENTYPNTDLGAAGRLAAMMNNVAKGMLGISSTLEEKNSAETNQVEAVIQDFANDVTSVKLALRRRKEKLYRLTTKLNRITKVGEKLDRMKEAAVNADAIAIQAQEGTLVEAREEANAAQVEFEIVSGRVIREFDWYRNVVDLKLRKIVNCFCAVQKEYNAKLDEGWGRVLASADVKVDAKVASC